jgi:Family of unknown function (DUF6282)
MPACRDLAGHNFQEDLFQEEAFLGGTMDAVSRLLQGSIDLHIHPSPSLFPRRLDAVEAAQQAAEARMRAIVIKSHHHTTAPELLPLKIHDLRDIPVEVFGGVALNSYVGGLNPYIVDMTLRMGGKIVWFPTISSENHIKHHEAQPHMKFPSQTGRELPDVPVKVLDERGELLPPGARDPGVDCGSRRHSLVRPSFRTGSAGLAAWGKRSRRAPHADQPS